MLQRKIVILGTLALFLLSGGSAYALTAAHQKGLTGYDGDCQACHIPHKASGTKRGFPIEPAPASVTTYGYIGAFCLARCHDGTLASANLSRSVMTNATATPPTVFGGGTTGLSQGSHGMNLLNTGLNAPASTVVASTLPYGNNTAAKAFECTTCHDVHKNATGDTSEALLQLDIDALCDECHTSRGAGNGTWAGYGTGNTTGSHPVGTNVTGDTGGGTSPITFATSFNVAYGASGAHNLGGHGINGAIANGMTCATCHAVHGSQADADPPNVNAIYSEDLLAVAVTGVTGTQDPDIHATGQGEVNNTVCEGCHGAASTKWNPGGGSFSHPVDEMSYSGTGPDVLDMGVIPAVTGMPNGANTTAGIAGPGIGIGAAAAGQGPRVICESCHVTHPNANAQATPTVARYQVGGVNVVATGTPLLRASSAVVASICDLCHSVTPTGHHPVAVAFGTGYGDTDIDRNANSVMDCSDCHGAATGGAHNWTAKGFPTLNALWEPLNNGRAAEDLITTGPNFVASTSKECADCHLEGTSPTTYTRFSPSRNTPGNGNAQYQDHGDGSHFLGLTAWLAADWQRGIIDGSTFSAADTTKNWNAKSGSHSRFAGTASTALEVVCESCHEIQMTRNMAQTTAPAYTGKNNLLLYNFTEGEVLAGTGSMYRNNLCEGCHGHYPGSPTASSSHPMTLGTLTKVVDLGATPTTLITTGTRSNGLGSYANAVGAPGTGTYPAANAMNCDSCHQTHDGPTNSGTYILDIANASIPAPTNPRGGATTLYTQSYSRSTTTAASGIDYDQFCVMCHTY